MSGWGQSRHFDREFGMTASPQRTDISSGDRLVRVVPITVIVPVALGLASHILLELNVSTWSGKSL